MSGRFLYRATCVSKVQTRVPDCSTNHKEGCIHVYYHARLLPYEKSYKLNANVEKI
jgi:hypothetical protein